MQLDIIKNSIYCDECNEFMNKKVSRTSSTLRTEKF